MRQIVQSLESGSVTIAEIPCPAVPPNFVLIRNAVSVISSGTERMLLQFGKAGWVGKARQQPERVRLVLDKMKTDGLAATVEAVRSKLSQPIPLGYSSAGIVMAVGSEVTEFRPGERVCSNGSHAETVAVSKNLCARVPDSVSDEAAAFTVLGAIALEGVRLAEPTLGETVAVIGLGLIGLLTVQLLRANGCRVLALDFIPKRLQLAEHFGAIPVDLSSGQDPVSAAEHFSHGRGLDATLITAAAKSSEPVHMAAGMCRKRGRIVLVGVSGLELCRDDFYKKELSFQVSCSYGPGRYDTAYERNGQDYPLPYVRWTAQRNFEAVIDLLSAGRLEVDPLITHRFSFECAGEAYELIDSTEPVLGVVLEYPVGCEHATVQLNRETIALSSWREIPPDKARVALIGAGSYASKTLMPALRDTSADLDLVISQRGLSAAHWGRKYGFKRASTEVSVAFADPSINTIAIATPHDSHGRLVKLALEAGKNVFVEKPLALSIAEIDEIEWQYGARASGSQSRLMIGFNRRFAPHVVRMKSLLKSVAQSKTIIVTVNAGDVCSGYGTQDPSIGGGRILGETCHFIDLLRFLVGAPTQSVFGLRTQNGEERSSETITFSISFEDGSVGTVHYVTTGHKAFPKERIEVFCAGRILQLDNFRTLRGWGWPGFTRMKLWRQDKGAHAMVSAFVDCIQRGEPSPISSTEIFEVSRRAIDIAALNL